MVGQDLSPDPLVMSSAIPTSICPPRSCLVPLSCLHVKCASRHVHVGVCCAALQWADRRVQIPLLDIATGAQQAERFDELGLLGPLKVGGGNGQIEFRQGKSDALTSQPSAERGHGTLQAEPEGAVSASKMRSLVQSPRIGILLHLDLADGTKLLSSSARVEVPRRALGHTQARRLSYAMCAAFSACPIFSNEDKAERLFVYLLRLILLSHILASSSSTFALGGARDGATRRV